MKIVSQLDALGYFTGPVEADESPLEPGVYLIPGGAIDVDPPTVPDGMVALRQGNGWAFVLRPDEPPEDPPVAGVPQTVTRFQARAALARAGLFTIVNNAMKAFPEDDERRLAWEDAQDFRRTSPTMLGMAASLGLTDADLDALFVTAAGIDA